MTIGHKDALVAGSVNAEQVLCGVIARLSCRSGCQSPGHDLFIDVSHNRRQVFRVFKSTNAFRLCAILSVVWMLNTATLHAQQRVAIVGIEKVELRELRDTVLVIGQLVATRRSVIASRIAGVIQSLDVEIGDQVKQGQALVTLDKSRLDIEKKAAESLLAVARAELKVSEAKLRLAKQTFERQQKLRSSTAFSRSRYDDLKLALAQARSEVAKAAAEVTSASSALNRVNYELKHAVVRAPFESIVIARQAQPGQYVAPGSAVVTLLDKTNLEVEADVPSNIAPVLRSGTVVSATFEGGIRLDVKVRTTVPVQDVSTRTRPVRFSLKMPAMKGASIAVGSTVNLHLPRGPTRKVATVPKDALLKKSGGWQVFTVKNGKAQIAPVTIGEAIGNRMELISGLRAGDLVIVRGNERLRPGQAVRAGSAAPRASRTGG